MRNAYGVRYSVRWMQYRGFWHSVDLVDFFNRICQGGGEMSVSFDDAWGMMAEEPARTEAPPQREKHRHRKKQAKRRRKHFFEEEEEEEQADVYALLRELAEMRSQAAAQMGTQSMILYIVAAIISILLVVIAQAFSKLNHALECMAWAHKKM